MAACSLPRLCRLNLLRSSIRTMAHPVFDNAQVLHVVTQKGGSDVMNFTANLPLCAHPQEGWPHRSCER